MSDRLANIVIGVVTTGWAINLIGSLIKFNGYQSDPLINGVFMGTVGLAFAFKFRGKTPPNDKGGEHRG